MFCSNCGKELPEDNICSCAQPTEQDKRTYIYEPSAQVVTYRQYTAPPINEGQQPYNGQPPMYEGQQPYNGQPIYGQPYEQQGFINESPPVRLLRQIGSSTIFLLLCILFSVSTLLSFFLALTSADTLQIFAETQVYINAPTAILSAIVPFILSALISLGMWLFYMSCKSINPIKTTGITLIKIGFMISTIGTSALLALITLASLMFTLPSLSEFLPPDLFTDSYTIIFGFIAAIVLIVLAILIVYIVFAVKTINSIYRVIKTGIQYKNIPAFLIVTGFISAAYFLFTTPANLSTFYMPLIHCVSFVLSSICLLQYRNGIKELYNSYNCKNY